MLASVVQKGGQQREWFLSWKPSQAIWRHTVSTFKEFSIPLGGQIVTHERISKHHGIAQNQVLSKGYPFGNGFGIVMEDRIEVKGIEPSHQICVGKEIEGLHK